MSWESGDVEITVHPTNSTEYADDEDSFAETIDNLVNEHGISNAVVNIEYEDGTSCEDVTKRRAPETFDEVESVDLFNGKGNA